jgi:DUF4097 and DUF4098 domain-containing protein YvlB
MRKDTFAALSATLSLILGCTEVEVHTEKASVDEKIDAVSVDLGSGDVRLRGADIAGASLSARIEGATNHLGHAVVDGQLELFDECNESHCSVDINAVIPAGVPIVVRTGSGDLALSSLLGAIHVQTDSGDIRGSGLAGVETGSGDVSLTLDDPAEQIVVKTGSGDVDLAVPSGRYRLIVSTGSGDSSISGVTSDEAANGSIAISTGSGDVQVRGR